MKINFKIRPVFRPPFSKNALNSRDFGGLIFENKKFFRPSINIERYATARFYPLVCHVNTLLLMIKNIGA